MRAPCSACQGRGDLGYAGPHSRARDREECRRCQGAGLAPQPKGVAATAAYVCAQCGKPCEIEIVGYWPRPHSRCCHMPARPAEERLPLDVIAIRDRGGTHAHDGIPPQESIAESPPGQDGSSMSANYRRGLADGADEEAPSRDSDEDYLRGYIAGRMDPARALAALMVNPPPVPAQMDRRSAPPVPAPPPPAPDPRGHAGRPSQPKAQPAPKDHAPADDCRFTLLEVD